MAVILTKRRSGGSSGSSSYFNLLIANEIAAGVKNNSNNIFSTSYDYLTGTLFVYYNGQRLVQGKDYEEQGSNAFKLTYVRPYSEDNLIVDYQIPT